MATVNSENYWELDEHTAIVTGAAKGFGKEFARLLLAKGARVCISDVNVDLGKRTTKQFAERFGPQKVTFFKCDVACEEDWHEMWNHVTYTFESPVTLLVNNAGVNPKHGWRACIDIMLKGVAIGTYFAIDKMSVSNKGKGGRIVNIASMAGLLHQLGQIEDAGYTMAKFGVVALTRAFDKRGRNGPWKKDGIKAMALCPWFADTDLVAESVELEKLQEHTGTRMLTVKEVGSAFLECLRLDKTGACYVVYPDSPLVEFENFNKSIIMAMLFYGTKIAPRLGLTSFGTPEFLKFVVVVVAAVFVLLSLFFAMLF